MKKDSITSMICNKCNNENTQESKFCQNCGTEIDLNNTTDAFSSRRYDVDSIRVIALLLLILYHTAISFQTWATEISFIENNQSLEPFWFFAMNLINIWRIPILFVVSGMGLRFAMERRNWSVLISDRMLRIGLPLVFGTLCVVPIYMYIFHNYYEIKQFYAPHPGHLWFLVNILFYVLILIYVFNYFKEHPENKLYVFLKRTIKKPFGIIPIFASLIIVESVAVNPEIYPLFVFSLHGWLIGLVCFFNGFVLVSLKEDFWNAVNKIKWLALILAVCLYGLRIYNYDSELISSRIAINLLTGFESANWMLAALGLGAAFLNKPSKLLSYMSSAVYPVYIVHLPIQFFFCSLVFPLSITASFKLLIVLACTYAGSFLVYEIVKRIKWVRLLFGMKNELIKNIKSGS